MPQCNWPTSITCQRCHNCLIHSVNTPQPPPTPSDHPAVWDMVIADMKERDRLGVEKYGVRLKPFDGRDSLVDAYQEALDLAVYLRKKIYEQRGA